MIDALQEYTASLPALLQWFGIMVAGAIPFVESYLGSALGILAGVNPVVAIAAAIIGNIICMLVLVLGIHTVRGKFAKEPKETTELEEAKEPEEATPRRKRLRAAFDKYGVAGVSLFGQTILPSQITSAALVSFGASKDAVVFWQVISIILWGLLFGILTTLGVDLLGAA